jgi:hypothetical protein
MQVRIFRRKYSSSRSRQRCRQRPGESRAGSTPPRWPVPSAAGCPAAGPWRARRRPRWFEWPTAMLDAMRQRVLDALRAESDDGYSPDPAAWFRTLRADPGRPFPKHVEGVGRGAGRAGGASTRCAPHPRHADTAALQGPEFKEGDAGKLPLRQPAGSPAPATRAGHQAPGAVESQRGRAGRQGPTDDPESVRGDRRSWAALEPLLPGGPGVLLAAGGQDRGTGAGRPPRRASGRRPPGRRETRCVAEIVNRFEGFSSRVPRQEFPAPRSRLPCLWSRRYDAGRVGAVSESVIRRYVDGRKGE